jgi:hypothetical protein
MRLSAVLVIAVVILICGGVVVYDALAIEKIRKMAVEEAEIDRSLEVCDRRLKELEESLPRFNDGIIKHKTGREYPAMYFSMDGGQVKIISGKVAITGSDETFERLSGRDADLVEYVEKDKLSDDLRQKKSRLDQLIAQHRRRLLVLRE